MIGTICGLAIYNFTIIVLPFPLALFKKLLNRSVTIFIIIVIVYMCLYFVNVCYY